ncbi:hypothetical protein ACH5RR_018783 [Cinchona calisaya]|uniref:Uncharacterized protein n=1 Tax=Cinchona calisaya TaxID=153742 RepID=A0ABD2ZMG0_9GENT
MIGEAEGREGKVKRRSQMSEEKESRSKRGRGEEKRLRIGKDKDERVTGKDKEERVTRRMGDGEDWKVKRCADLGGIEYFLSSLILTKKSLPLTQMPLSTLTTSTLIVSTATTPTTAPKTQESSPSPSAIVVVAKPITIGID